MNLSLDRPSIPKKQQMLANIIGFNSSVESRVVLTENWKNFTREPSSVKLKMFDPFCVKYLVNEDSNSRTE